MGDTSHLPIVILHRIYPLPSWCCLAFHPHRLNTFLYFLFSVKVVRSLNGTLTALIFLHWKTQKHLIVQAATHLTFRLGIEPRYDL